MAVEHPTVCGDKYDLHWGTGSEFDSVQLNIAVLSRWRSPTDITGKRFYTVITNTIWEVTVLLMRGFRESQTHVFPGTNSNSNHDDKGHKFPANFSIVARSPLVIQWYMLTECRPCVMVLFLVILLLMILQRRIVRLPTWWQVIETGAHALYLYVYMVVGAHTGWP